MQVAIIGTGYVGLVTGACLAAHGHSVVCVDTDSERVAALARGKTPIHEKGLPDLVSETRRQGRLTATTDLAAAVRAAEITMICVGTPSDAGRIDLSAIKAAADQIGRALKDSDGYHVVTVKSTVVPGTTGQLVRSIIETESGKRLGSYGLCMNPEFLSQGSAVADFMHPDRIVIGQADARSGEVLARLYNGFSCPVLHMNLANAELVKYAANSFQACLISFANQIAAICEHIPEANEAAIMNAVHLDRHLCANSGQPAPATKFLAGGIGFGGSCFPKDLLALRHFARTIGAPSTMLDAIIDTNLSRPDQILDLLERNVGSVEGRVISVLGLTFKPDTDDLRESPGLKIIEQLVRRGALVRGHDPLAIARRRAAPQLPSSVELPDRAEQALAGADAAIIATAWPEYRDMDWDGALASMRRPIVLDGRNLLAGRLLPGQARLIRIGTAPA